MCFFPTAKIMTSLKKVTRQQPTTGSSNIAAQTGNCYTSETASNSNGKVEIFDQDEFKEGRSGGHIAIVVCLMLCMDRI